MTCHVAMLASNGAVMISDSQASNETSEWHGIQKMLAGPDYLLGGAGSMELINAIFHEIEISSPSATGVEHSIVDFFDREVREHACGQVEILLVLANEIKLFRPRVFKHFRKQGEFSSIGSGSEFVFRAIQRDQKLGIVVPKLDLIESAITVETYIDAANESLTVNDKLMLGFVVGNKSYIMGDSSISPNFINHKLGPHWPLVSTYFDSIMTLIKQIRSAYEVGQWSFSAIRQGNLTNFSQIAAANGNIRDFRDELNKIISKYMTWYDGVVRP